MTPSQPVEQHHIIRTNSGRNPCRKAGTDGTHDTVRRYTRRDWELLSEFERSVGELKD